MINIQPIEKLAKGDGSSLEVHSIFYTIQGEGPFAGCPAVFIRLAGCNLQCPGCDTEYTKNRRILSIQEIADKVNALKPVKLIAHDRPLVVITGGEPFRQNIVKLWHRLNNDNYLIQIETNGTLSVPKYISEHAIIVISPKIDKVNPVFNMFRNVFYKYVLDANSIDPIDGLPTMVLGNSVVKRVARPPKYYPIYVQPMDPSPGPERDSQYRANIEACVKSSMAHGYTLQLQTHKIIGVE